jgi:phage host-nuclease inhibitor protein Gam
MSENEYEELIRDVGVLDELPDSNRIEAAVHDEMAQLKKKSYAQLVALVKELKVLVALNFIVMVVVLIVIMWK